MLISFLERRLKNRLKLATSYLFYATLYRKGRIMPNQKEFLFSYNNYKIRAVVDSNELLFCLADILKALNWYSTSTGIVANKIKAHFKLSEVPTYKFKHACGAECFIITKTWFYFIIASLSETKSIKANDFIKWFNTEVLQNTKQIERYNLDESLEVKQSALQVPKSYSEALFEAGRLALENEKLLTEAKEYQPKVEALREFLKAYRDFILEVDKILDKLDKFES